MDSIPPPSKSCPQCRQQKPLSDFGKHAGTPDGRQVHCTDCRKAYYRAHPEKPKASAQKWREANPERKRSVAKQWRERNRDRILAGRRKTPYIPRSREAVPGTTRRIIVQPVSIYQIYCIANDTIYIGKAVDIPRRWSAHRTKLTKDTHNNVHLQRAWNKYGKSAFKFEIINIVENELVALDVEKQWIAILKQSGIRLFNQTDGGEGLAGYARTPEQIERIASKQRGVKRGPVSEQRRQQLITMNKGRKRSKESVEKSRIARTGQKRTPEQRTRMSEGMRRAKDRRDNDPA